MDWDLCISGKTLLAEVNALYPGRDKRTDGTISGYPGARSSHNVNAAGKVCALDITTGGYAGGISVADGQALAERLRVACRDQPRGITTYGIHWMAPPYVAVAGPKICSAPYYEWRPYTGDDLHTSHQHWSFDADIYTGEPPSGLADYDLTLPWLTASLTEMDIDMATPAEVVTALLDHPITLRDGTKANLETHLVNLFGNANATLKAKEIITAMDGTTAPVHLVLANLGADVRAIKTVTDALP